MKLISWNVNGIRACQKKGFLEFVDREKPDILCLQETKAHKEQLDESLLNPLGYSYWSSATTRKGYSGTVTYCRQEPKSVEYGIGIPEFDAEGRFVITQFEDFWLYNVYFPNGAAREERHLFKQEFLQIFRDHLAEMIDMGEKVIVCGDYNVAHKETDVHDPVRLSKVSGFLPEERQWFDGFLEAGFVDTFKHAHPDAKERFSWWSYREMARPANRGWRIDYFCMTKNLLPQFKGADILDQQHGSDHCPVTLTLS